MGCADSSAEFIRKIGSLMERLASRNVVVRDLHCAWGPFGSWRVEIEDGAAADAYSDAVMEHRSDGKGPDVVRFLWDGRDQLLTVKTSPTHDLSARHEWTLVLETPLGGFDEALRFVEDYVLEQ